jgi:hypothetical protein
VSKLVDGEWVMQPGVVRMRSSKVLDAVNGHQAVVLAIEQKVARKGQTLSSNCP